jgi:hypothetical protein
MRTVTAGRRRLKERGIRWEEYYGEKSADVKKKFDKILPGSYFRWEGFDYETKHPYYVVVGPAISKRYGKSFFAGVKKMPKDPKKKSYAPSGKYFSSLRSALSHASDMWGITFPREAGNYTKDVLAGIDIPRHMKA